MGRSTVGRWWWTVDHWLLGAVAVLILLGVILSFGSSPAAALRTGEGGPFHFAIRQTAFAGMAACLVVAVSMLSPRGVRRAAFFGAQSEAQGSACCAGTGRFAVRFFVVGARCTRRGSFRFRGVGACVVGAQARGPACRSALRFVREWGGRARGAGSPV